MRKNLYTPKCGVPRCSRPHYARGVCRPHYERFRNGRANPTKQIGKQPQWLFVQPQTGCAVPGCENAFYALSVCQSHYNSLRAGKEATGDTPKCTVPGCKLVHVAKGYCVGHYFANRARALSAQVEAVIKEAI
jgi:hypothetical protein